MQAVTGPDEVAPLLAALPLLSAALTRLELRVTCESLYIKDNAALQQAQIDALLAAVAARSSLESLSLTLTRYIHSATTAALAALGACLPALTEFGLGYANLDDEVGGKLPVLQLPWHQLQKLRLTYSAAALLPQLLAREAPALRSLELFSNASLDARALSQAPWFAQLTRLDVHCRHSAADLFAGAPAQLALQELRVFATGRTFSLDAARRLAATAMPLRRLKLSHPAAGVVEAIAGAPWASSLHALQLRCAVNFETPAAAGAAAAALASAPLGALTSLELRDTALGPDAVPLSRLLAAPWAPGLRELVLAVHFPAGAGFDAAAAACAVALAALAAAPLPALRVLGLEDLCLEDAALSDALAAAPWLQRLEQLTLYAYDPMSLQAFEALAAADVPSLTQLDIFSDSLSAPAVAALAAAPWLPRLQRLCLRGILPDAAYEACAAALDQERSPFSALLDRGGEVDTSDLIRSQDLELMSPRHSP